MVKIAPSILSADFMRLEDEIVKAAEAGADMLHIDVMDGLFVPNLTIGPFIVKQISKITALPLDVHLMIEKPARYIEEFIACGAKTLTVHVEGETHLHSTINKIKTLGAKAGAALNPATPLCLLDDILEDLDVVMIMSVNPGFGGQKFIAHSLDKLENLKSMIERRKCLNTEIEIDGGINTDNAAEAVKRGAQILVMGSAFFNSQDYNKTASLVRTSTAQFNSAVKQ
ncbi:ribulose-phosphate 3-epimerase [Candidatus Magnetoovum chiemensis]|nr:ribulose-phosphate 3-epimerase [Candidatus Magnetoovum chiemensis]